MLTVMIKGTNKLSALISKLIPSQQKENNDDSSIIIEVQDGNVIINSITDAQKIHPMHREPISSNYDTLDLDSPIIGLEGKPDGFYILDTFTLEIKGQTK